MPRQGQKSKDPVQQHLREHKRNWSDNTSEFIAKLIAFKRGLNGRGDAQAGLPPSSIKEPLPGEIGSALDQLASQFQGLVQDAGSIMDEQSHYSKVRRRKRPKAPTPTPAAPAPENAPAQQEPAAPTDNVVDTLSRLGSEYYEMEKAASNRLTRMWEYIKAPFSRQEHNKHRISMLSLTADLYYSFLDFENDILSLSISSIPRSIKKYQMVKYNYEELKDTLGNLLDIIERKKEQPTTVPIPEQSAPQTVAPQPAISAPKNIGSIGSVEDIKKDIHVLSNEDVSQKEIVSLFGLIRKFEIEEDQNMKLTLARQIRDRYDAFLNSKPVVEAMQKKYGPAQISSGRDIINLIRKNKIAFYADSEIVKTAHNLVTRYLKKQLVKALSFNKTAVHRLEIAEVVDDTKKLLKTMMNELQSGLSAEELQKELAKLEENMKRIHGPLKTLDTMYRQEYYAKKKKTKVKDAPEMDQDEFRDFLLKRRVKRDLLKDM